MNANKSLLSKRWQPASVALSISALVVVLGCGDESGLSTRYKVNGKVTLKGAPISKGTINFVPSKPPVPEGRAASGEIKDGSYSLSTAGKEDGALPGEYTVTIVSLDLDMSSAASSKEEGGMVHQGDPAYQKATKSAKSLVPTKYNIAETSGLKATVTSGANKFDFDLKDE